MRQDFSRYSLLVFLLLRNVVHSSATCQDYEGSFTITEVPLLAGMSVRCSWVDHMCDYAEIQRNCRQTCNLCASDGEQLDSSVYECVDVEGKFFLSALGENKGCAYIRRKDTVERCAKHVEARANCRATCGTCFAPSASPSSSPTAKPSAKPSAKPTKMPSPSPSAAPTKNPSPSPSSSPTDCVDLPDLERFYIGDPIFEFKTCEWVKRRDTVNRCLYSESIENCPRTCGMCANEPSASPTISAKPSQRPSR